MEMFDFKGVFVYLYTVVSELVMQCAVPVHWGLGSSIRDVLAGCGNLHARQIGRDEEIEVAYGINKKRKNRTASVRVQGGRGNPRPGRAKWFPMYILDGISKLVLALWGASRRTRPS